MKKNSEEIFSQLLTKYSVVQIEKVKDQLNGELMQWQKATNRKLKIDNPFFENQKKYKDSRTSFEQEEFNIESLEKDFAGYEELSRISRRQFDREFWEEEIAKHKKNKQEDVQHKPKLKQEKSEELQPDLKVSRKLMLQKWEESLIKVYSEWELSEIEKYRKEVLKKLKEWLELMQQIQDVMQDLNLDTGLLFDLSQGNLSMNDINQLKKWAEYLTQNKEVKELCDMLGRLRSIEKSTKQEIIKTTTHIKHTIKDYTSKEEIVGITIGKEIERILPQELALLGDEELSILFDKKYVEAQLMNFDLEGTAQIALEKDEESIKEVSEEEKMGPIIICVDTSGSMRGTPETIAKAIALTLTTRAKSQNRDCFLINFSTSIDTLELTGEFGLKRLIEFLGQSFNGGTDVAPAIKYAIKKMQEEAYKRADLLIISDFVMGALPADIAESIKSIKEMGNKFYSLSIGDIFLETNMKDIFDGEWVYNPRNISVMRIMDMLNEIDKN